MAIRAKVTTTGGSRLKAHLEWQRRRVRGMPIVVEVGFKDRRIAVLAANLEFGNPSTNLPERPAFRVGSRESHEAVRRALAELPGPMTVDKATRIATIARDTIRRAYLTYHGPGLSERQRARKAGTQYADDELVGHEGPKLIGHIHGYVNGRQVPG